MSNSEVADAKDIDSMDFVLNLEVLNQCAHHCTGCFVRRKNNLEDVDLDKALALAKDMDSKGLRFREVIISPTDIFSATNSLDILDNPAFQELMSIHPKTRITTTAMFENMNWQNFKDVFAILDDPTKFKSDMILEFLVPMNTEKVINRDEIYLAQFKKALKFLAEETPKEVDWSFVVNVHHDPVFMEHFEELTQIAQEEFNTIIEFLPSFFRTGNDSLIEQHLGVWKDFLSTSVTQDNYKDVMLTIADKNHNGFNTIVTNYKKGKLHISPFIYEQITYDYPELTVDGYTAEDVMDKNTDLIIEQYEYSAKTKSCQGCDYLSTCVGRNVLSFMEIKGITDCIYPKDVLDMYHNQSALSGRVQRCNNRMNEEILIPLQHVV